MRRKRTAATGSEVPPGEASGNRQQMVDLWFALARFDWSSLVIIPGSVDDSLEELAKSLAETGQHLGERPVSAVTVKVVGPASVRALLGLVQRFKNDNPQAVSPPPIQPEVAHLLTTYAERQSPDGGPGRAHLRTGTSRALGGDCDPVTDGDGGKEWSEPGFLPPGKLIIALPSVLTQPLGVAVARAADGVVLGIETGRTRLAEVSRTAELIGREHLLGTCLFRNASP